MTNEQFDHLASVLEAKARANPSAYRWKVFLLLVLGNAYIAAVLLLVAALVLGLVLSVTQLGWIAAKPIAVLIVCLWIVLKASWVRCEPPTGIEITAEQAPELFAMINELQSRIPARGPNHVLITSECDAGVLQLPCLGLFGWSRNYLWIGLPLMKSLTIPQLNAALAHEFGHLCRGHGKITHSIYRQRLRWSCIMTEVEANESKSSFILKPFFNRFVPYFTAFTFPLARQNEYEADAIAARLSSPRALAETLTNIEVASRFLDEVYWPRVRDAASEHPQPTGTPYSSMTQALEGGFDRTSIARWLDQATVQQTASTDTHPCLSARLKTMGEVASFNPPCSGDAADRLLGSSLAVITEAFDRRWRVDVFPSWEMRHRQVQEGRARLTGLNAQWANGVSLALDDAYHRAELTELVGRDPESALVQFRELHHRAPDDPDICFALGSRLIVRNDGTGAALIEYALKLNDRVVVKGCELLRDYYCRAGNAAEYQVWAKRFIRESELQHAAATERNGIALVDEIEPHGLAADALSAFLAQLWNVRGLRTVYVVKKCLMYFAHRPLYIVGYRATGGSQRGREVLERIKQCVHQLGDALIISLDGKNYRFRRKFCQIRGSKVFYLGRLDLRPGQSVEQRMSRLTIWLQESVTKIIALLAILLGLLLLFYTINLGAALMSVGMICVGTRWLTDPLD